MVEDQADRRDDPGRLSEAVLLSALVAACGRASIHAEQAEPGDLVVEVTSMSLVPDSDGIGWLVAHGDAPYAEDGTGPTRDVWDIVPLRGLPVGRQRELGYQRWENARFSKAPRRVAMILERYRPVADQDAQEVTS